MKVLTAILLLALASVAAAEDSMIVYLNAIEQQYPNLTIYNLLYRKRYSTPFEESYRWAIYNVNLFQYVMINQNQNNTYKAGINIFSDMIHEEFVALYLNLKLPAPSNTPLDNSDLDTYRLKAITDIDWVKNNKSSVPKDMGACGTSWVFAAVGAVEGAFASKNYPRPNFSEQQVMDCAPAKGSGCDGDYISTALRYIQDKGVTEEGIYPLSALKQPQPCRKDVKGIFKIADFNDLLGCTALISSLAKAPVAVAVDASNWAHYVTGILNKCGSTPNYAAVVVGATKDYWKIKSAWSVNWGEAGYIRIAAGNTCGICNYAVEVQL